METKLCHRTLRADNNSDMLGAACIKEKCMRWCTVDKNCLDNTVSEAVEACMGEYFKTNGKMGD